MSTHSYSRLWTHLIWETLRREPMLDKRAAAKASGFLTDYSLEKGIYMKVNYFNADHTHALIGLPTNICIEEVIKLLKGSSSHWIDQQKMLKGHFSWGRDMERFQFLTRMSIVLRATLPIKKSIIGRRRLQKSMSSLFDDMDLNGATKETVETVRSILAVTLTPG
jgi:putative transposase